MEDRVPFEFFCSGNCQGYVMMRLDPTIDANVILVCSGCRHEHYRVQRGGKITEDRHSMMQDTEHVHRVEPVPAAFSKKAQITTLGKVLPYLGSVLSKKGGL